MTDDLMPTPAQDGETTPRPTAAAPLAGRRSSADVAAHRPAYKGEELDAARGPGLGCFWFQAAVLAFFLVLIPVGVNLNWPYEVLAALLFVVLGLLLFVGQTLIFLLRLVAADRRDTGRRRPRASATPTVGEIEDALAGAPGTGDAARADVADVNAAVAGELPAPVDEGPADPAGAPAPPTAGPAELPAPVDEGPADPAGAPAPPTAEPGSESVRE